MSHDVPVKYSVHEKKELFHTQYYIFLSSYIFNAFLKKERIIDDILWCEYEFLKHKLLMWMYWLIIELSLSYKMRMR